MNHRVYPYIGGLIWLDAVNSKMMAIQSRSEYEPEKLEAMAGWLKPGMTFVDAGACVGYFSLYAAKLVGPTGKVYAFEPEPVNVGWLKRNRYLNGYDNIEIMEYALGEETDFKGKLLSLTAHPGQHSLVPKNEAEYSYPVSIRRLDSVVSEHVDAMKIDVQGYDINVLLGSRRTLTSKGNTLLMIDLHPSLGVDCDELRGIITEMGYRILSSNSHSLIARKE